MIWLWNWCFCSGIWYYLGHQSTIKLWITWYSLIFRHGPWTIPLIHGRPVKSVFVCMEVPRYKKYFRNCCEDWKKIKYQHWEKLLNPVVIIKQAASHTRKFLIFNNSIMSFYGNPSWNSLWNLAREILGRWRGGRLCGRLTLVLRGRQEVPKISSERLARIDSVSRHFDFLEFLSWYHSKIHEYSSTYIDWYQQPRTTGKPFNTKYPF